MKLSEGTCYICRKDATDFFTVNGLSYLLCDGCVKLMDDVKKIWGQAPKEANSD